MNKCTKYLTCLYCGSTMCQYEEELQRLKAENEKFKRFLKEIRDLKISQNIKDDVLKMINEVLADVDS